ncbi:MAG TPA: hypothetical protein VNE39_13575 [Planctomycetota bacterium]|nr:hypothetical protein [Planctomycetota bacterium]
MRKWPAFYAPVWSANGATLYYVALRPDGGLAIREVDVASRKGGELTTGRFQTPPAAIALSPQGDKVACAAVARESGGPPVLRLHVLSAAGSADRVAWEAPCGQGRADICWLPDGRSLLVAADRPAGWSLHRVPAEGGAARAIAADLFEVRGPTASPDGQRVAFVARARAGEPWSLYVASAGGGSCKVVAPAIFREYGVGYGPVWSPRGDAVAFVAERYLCPGRSEIVLWDPAAGVVRPLARNLAGGCIAPAWSPSGDSIAYVSLPLGVAGDGPGASGYPADILVAEASGQTPRTLVADGLANLMPSWSPDGRRLAFTTCGEPEADPHVVRLAELETGTVQLAEDCPDAELLLALARYRRGGAPALAGLQAAAARATGPDVATLAARVLADGFAASGEWANAASAARKAAESRDAQAGLHALRLLARAQMRLGNPKGALATAEAILSRGADGAAQALREALRSGIETAQRLEAEVRDAPSPVVLQALADTHLRQLGNPRGALDLLFRLAKEFPQGSHLRAAAESVLGCAGELGGQAVSYRVLEWAAGQLGADTLTPSQRLLLAQAAAANGDGRAALRWLAPLASGPVPAGLRSPAAEAFLAAADQLAAIPGAPEVLSAYRRAMALGSGGVAARAALGAARLLARGGGHWEATRLLLEALAPQAPPAVRREALRLLAVGRLQRRDPLAYEIAEVAQHAAFGFLDAAIARGEQLEPAVAVDPARRAALRQALAEAFDGLVAYHLARGDAGSARGVLARWLRGASRGHDLPRALAQLAACHRTAGDTRSLVEVLSRLAAEFPDRPEGAQARRELLLLDTSGTPPGPGH